MTDNLFKKLKLNKDNKKNITTQTNITTGTFKRRDTNASRS